MIRKIAWAGLMLSAAACTDATGFSAQQQRHFGDATTSNTAVMKGDRSYAIQLAGRFAKEVPNTINFDFDSARLDQDARAVLDRQAHWIKQFPEVRFRVFGHTDAVGSNAYNKSLGLRRARAAVNYLVSRGISRNRLEAVVSFGETQPLIPTPDRERRNRRTVTEVSGFLKRHPTLLDGKYAKVIYREYIESAIPPTSLTITTIDEG
ncbi:OmpA family protein [Leisingera sp. SS27]|uniref:OmpA family protein n=1 Tax=Leisingera sp. SS27 TaxID=2979462 RepID=UPI0023304A28|nr:OmpA family protein [Leisingera sp. SS27]MDC0657479.1 OmpA family protein [Leisingera sp. SS27]